LVGVFLINLNSAGRLVSFTYLLKRKAWMLAKTLLLASSKTCIFIANFFAKRPVLLYIRHLR